MYFLDGHTNTLQAFRKSSPLSLLHLFLPKLNMKMNSIFFFIPPYNFTIHNSIMPTTLSKLITHPLLWRFTGFVSSIVGFSCYALSPSFQDLFGHWNRRKIIIYAVVASILSIMMLLVKRCSWRLVRSFLLKAHFGFLVLTLTSLYSFLEGRGEEGKADQKGYYFGRVMNLTSTAAFALMALSISRQLELGFEAGVFNFLLGCFLIAVMKMNIKLAPVAAFLCYLLVNFRSFSDLLVERGSGATKHGDGLNSLHNELQISDISEERGDTEHGDGLNSPHNEFPISDILGDMRGRGDTQNAAAGNIFSSELPPITEPFDQDTTSIEIVVHPPASDEADNPIQTPLLEGQSSKKVNEKSFPLRALKRINLTRMDPAPIFKDAISYVRKQLKKI